MDGRGKEGTGWDGMERGGREPEGKGEDGRGQERLGGEGRARRGGRGRQGKAGARRCATHVLELAEGHELDDVAQHGLALGGAQHAVVPVQDLHVREVGVAHADDDDGHGQVGGADDGLPRVRHVRHHAVGQDQQDEILLGGQGRSGAARPPCAGSEPGPGGAGAPTEASLVRSSSAATRATLEMMGATLVGP